MIDKKLSISADGIDFLVLTKLNDSLGISPVDTLFFGEKNQNIIIKNSKKGVYSIKFFDFERLIYIDDENDLDVSISLDSNKIGLQSNSKKLLDANSLNVSNYYYQFKDSIKSVKFNLQEDEFREKLELFKREFIEHIDSLKLYREQKKYIITEIQGMIDSKYFDYPLTNFLITRKENDSMKYSDEYLDFRDSIFYNEKYKLSIPSYRYLLYKEVIEKAKKNCLEENKDSKSIAIEYLYSCIENEKYSRRIRNFVLYKLFTEIDLKSDSVKIDDFKNRKEFKSMFDNYEEYM